MAESKRLRERSESWRDVAVSASPRTTCGDPGGELPKSVSKALQTLYLLSYVPETAIHPECDGISRRVGPRLDKVGQTWPTPGQARPNLAHAGALLAKFGRVSSTCGKCVPKLAKSVQHLTIFDPNWSVFVECWPMSANIGKNGYSNGRSWL